MKLNQKGYVNKNGFKRKQGFHLASSVTLRTLPPKQEIGRKNAHSSLCRITSKSCNRSKCGKE